MIDSTLAAALQYVRSGWRVVPIERGQKRPPLSLRDWQNMELAEPDLAAHFNDSRGVGLLLGTPSGGLVDVDLDAPHTLRCAAALLPKTGRRHGRASKPRSHYWYRVEVPTGNTLRLKDPIDKATLIELRATGGQTVVPPSLHPSGELLVWEATGEPARVKWEALRADVERVAAVALLAKHWPTKGGRHDASLALAGALLRGGVPEQEARRLVRLVAEAASDEEAAARESNVASTARRLETGAATTGLRSMADLFDRRVVSKVAEWLRLRTLPLQPAGGDGPQPVAEALLYVSPSADAWEAGQDPGDPERSGGIVTASEKAPVLTATDVGNAARFARDHAVKVHFSRTLRWLAYDGRRWVQDATGEVERLARETARGIYAEAAACLNDDDRRRLAAWARLSESLGRIRAMVALAESELSLVTTADAFDRDPWLFNVENGTLDLRTGELRPHQREDRITKLAPVRYDADAKSPLWLSFLDRIMDGNSALIAFLQRAVGSALTGDTRDHALFVLHGGGKNGKSTFVETIRSIYGDYAFNTVAETLMAKRDGGIPNDVARLRGARFVDAIESEEGQPLAESRVKRLTGGDIITARFLHREFFEFHPEFKLFLATNHKPKIAGTDEGIWRRVKLVPFSVTIPEPERDLTLKSKLLAEAPGVLAWAVEGCRRWLADGLNPPEAVRMATDEYREEQDTFGDFIRDECVVAAGLRGIGLYLAYERWAKENGHRVMSAKTFKLRMADRGFTSGRDKKYRFFLGLGLRADEQDDAAA